MRRNIKVVKGGEADGVGFVDRWIYNRDRIYQGIKVRASGTGPVAEVVAGVGHSKNRG